MVYVSSKITVHSNKYVQILRKYAKYVKKFRCQVKASCLLEHAHVSRWTRSEVINRNY